jgi:GTPase SAR1 family protein
MYESLERSRCDNPAPMALVGNKCDLDELRMVATETGKMRAAQWGSSFIECSAKTGENVQQIFVELVREILAKRAKQTKLMSPAKKQRMAACNLL